MRRIVMWGMIAVLAAPAFSTAGDQLLFVEAGQDAGQQSGDAEELKKLKQQLRLLEKKIAEKAAAGAKTTKLWSEETGLSQHPLH